MSKIKLIADGGGTKTEWRVLDGSSKKSFYTAGISPYYLTTPEIQQLLSTEFPKSVFKLKIDEIYYYGTGCKTKAKAKIVHQALMALFPKAKIQVTHDLMGAAVATCGNESGIVCILGTGSNSCYYNGKKMVSNSPGLGYVLGDEGSGAYLGKKVLQHFLYGIFDEALLQSFLKTYSTSTEEILHKVYKESFPNRYLASFAQFLSLHRGHYMIENIIEDGLRDFFDQHLQFYPQKAKLSFHFVGGIAHHFKDKIAELCTDYGFVLGKILKQPMKGIAAYHGK
jgi:N-acetylglucosamine kinase-like BadF-type ATPase